MTETKCDIPIGMPEFYKNKSLLVTGFTGFLGKVLVEKVLYSCPDVEKIYILVRGKKGLGPQERVDEVLSSRAFKRMQETNPELLKTKLVVIPGDILEDKLGLSQENLEILQNKIEIFIHSAATVRFDEPLKAAVNTNTVATLRVVKLALKMPHLICFTYISTAYTNCDFLHIKEEIYPPKTDYNKTIQVSEKIDPATLQILLKKYIGKMPNTYTFTKSLCEQVVNAHKHQLPLVIIRPSIIVAAVKEPLPGWIGSKYGPGGIMLGYLLGILRCNFMVLNEKSNCIHSDIVVNATLIATYKKAIMPKQNESQDLIPVYNVCEPPWYSVTNEYYADIQHNHELMDQIIKDRIHFKSLHFSETEFKYRINNLYRHVFPAYIIDSILRIMNKKPMLLSVRRTVFIATLTLAHFVTRTFKFDTNNFDSLLHGIKDEDKVTFGWQFIKENVHSVYVNGYREIKHSYLKPVFEDLETNRKYLMMLYYVDRFGVIFTYSMVAFLIYQFSVPQLLLSAVVSFFTLQ